MEIEAAQVVVARTPLPPHVEAELRHRTTLHWSLSLADSFVITAGDLQLMPRVLAAAGGRDERPDRLLRPSAYLLAHNLIRLQAGFHEQWQRPKEGRCYCSLCVPFR